MACTKFAIISRQVFGSILLVLLAATAVNCTVTLKPFSTLYLPYAYDSTDTPLYGLGSNAAEQIAHDPKGQMVYVVGDAAIHIIDISLVYDPKIVYHTSIDYVANDIEICGDYVAVAVAGVPVTAPGSVFIFNLYDTSTGQWNKVQEITVGSLPDMLLFTKDCQKIVVCNEGEPGDDGQGGYVDPEGSVAILTFASTDLTQAPTVQIADFTAFNSRANEYVENGVRAPLMDRFSFLPSNFSQNMEPEYVAINKDNSIAYIGLQENNAIAKVDIVSGNVTEIYPMGYKDFSVHGLDPSDKDDDIQIKTYPIYGLYQPDAIKYIFMNDDGYIVTANEGADMGYTFYGNDWTDAMRGEDFHDDDLLSKEVSKDLQDDLNDDNKLGRLFFSTVDGINADDKSKYDKFYAFGSRSISVIRTVDMKMVYDTGDEMEQIHASLYPDIFNMNAGEDDHSVSPKDTMDSRSDNGGPSPESLAYGKVGTKDIVFVGLERTSTIMLYHVDHSDGLTFESVYRAGGINDTFQELYDDKNVGDLDPEDLRFLDEDDSPSARPLLIVSGTLSGTVSLYDVIDDSNVSSLGRSSTMEYSVLLNLLLTSTALARLFN
ncbi:mesenchyme-specific cell surface glycoprotein-like [Ptychodera flava]|uniref:mesenchyme-specific cell surface glycoprotein-like n=1 Tax=Ptychodera flava TaxID=63121 RepID=UPI00396A513D